MANITPSVTIDINKELGNLQLYKYQPNAIVQVSLNRLQDMLDGKVAIVEPSNPFTYLLETSCLNTAFAVQEFALLTRKLYPRLANTDDDLYLHMSDYDYVGRFSEPSYARVIFNIMFNDFHLLAHYNAAENEYVLKIPRHLKVMVGSYTYTLSSAIIIRLSQNGVVDVRFENQDYNNIFPVSTNHINFVIRNVNNNEQYIVFELDMPEVDIEVSDFPVDMTSVFTGSVPFHKDRKFYIFRAFYRKGNDWKEMLVTHTNEVYDINTPTCIIKVNTTDHTVRYSIPSVYLNNRMVSGNVRFLVYTTTGYSLVNFSDFKIGDFSVEYGDVFPETELDDFTSPLQQITKIIYIQENVSSGKDGLTFDQLKGAVIDNSIGDRKLPITAKQLEFAANQINFKIIKDVDVVTNRIYKLETQTPVPKTRYPLTKYNLDIMEFRTPVKQLREGNNVKAYGDDITVIPQGTVFRMNADKPEIVSQSEATNLSLLYGAELVAATNSRKYLSLYYHYILDTSGNTAKLKAYDITKPSVKYTSFKTFNDTARIGVNSVTNNLYKSSTGYTLDVLTNVKKFTETITHLNVKPYLIYTDVSGSRFYLSSNLLTSLSGQPVYRFIFETDYFIDADNNIHVTNFVDANGVKASIFIELDCKLEMLFVCDNIARAFVPTEMDNFIRTSYLVGNRCAVTLEEIRLVFGHHLKHLFSSVHSSVGQQQFEINSTDVYLRYNKTVYASDNTVLHSVGDLVKDSGGNNIVQFEKGTPKLDEYGQMIPLSTINMMRYLNLMFIDYRVGLCNSKADKEYSNDIRAHITKVCLDNAAKVQEQILDNSEAFVVVPKTLGDIKIKTATHYYTIPSSQKFALSMYVNFVTYNNAEVRDAITYSTIKLVDEYLYSNNILKKTELLNKLYTSLQEFVISVSFDKFTEIDSEYIQVIDENSRLSIEKQLSVTSTGYELKENIDVIFKLVEQ